MPALRSGRWCTLALIIFITGCTTSRFELFKISEANRLKFYEQNKSDLQTIFELSQKLANASEFDHMTITVINQNRHNKKIESLFCETVLIKGRFVTDQWVSTFSYSVPALELYNHTSPGDVAYSGYWYFPYDALWRQILPLVVRAHPEAIKIFKGGMFVALGDNRDDIKARPIPTDKWVRACLLFSEPNEHTKRLKMVGENVFLDKEMFVPY